MYHEHKLRILRYSMKNIWMLIFPFLRGLSVWTFDPAGIYAWIRGAWLDIAVLGIILLYGYIRWYCSRITITDDAIIHTEGCFVIIERTIPFESISVSSTERVFYLIPLKATMLRCETRAGFFKSTDLSIMVSDSVGREIMSNIPEIDHKNEIRDIPEPDIKSIMLFSVFFSSGFSGAVYIAAFFFKGGEITRDIIELSLSRITETTEMIYSRLLIGIPKIAVITGLFFLAAWFLSFFMNVTRYARFRISADSRYYDIVCGLFKRRRYKIKVQHINYTDIRQNIIMKLCHAFSVNISCPGYGSNSYLPVLIPLRNGNSSGGEFWSDGVVLDEKPQYRPKKSAFISYAGIPAILTIIMPVLYRFAERLFPDTGELIIFLFIMAEIPSIWFTAVKTVALNTTGLSVYDDKIVIRCSKWTSFHTVIAKRNHIALIQIKQNIFQRIFKKCSIVIWLNGESKSKYTIKSLPEKMITECELFC